MEQPIAGGYVIFARRFFDRDSWTWADLDHEQRAILQWLVFRARWKQEPKVMPVGNGTVRIERGQLFTSYKKIAKECRSTKKRVRTCLRIGSQMDFLRAQARAGLGLHITICNYDRYQNPDNYVGHTPGTTLGTHRARTGHAVGTVRNKGIRKEGEEGNNLLPPTTPRARSSPDYSPGFKRWWKTYPSGSRKASKPKCHEIWQREALEGRTDELVRKLDALKGTQQWQEGFWPAPLTYLRQRRFDDDLVDTSPGECERCYEPAVGGRRHCAHCLEILERTA